MGLSADLEAQVKKIFKDKWTTRDGQKVPEAEDLKLANDAVRLDATVLYADLSGSTQLVDDFTDWFAAEVYKSYLHCSAKIIRSAGGSITSYDGDRIMGVFIGDAKNSSAARAGLKINYMVKHIINPTIKAKYPKTPYEARQTVGIDTSKVFVARTGIRGSNDLVWVGQMPSQLRREVDLSFPELPNSNHRGRVQHAQRQIEVLQGDGYVDQGDLESDERHHHLQIDIRVVVRLMRLSVNFEVQHGLDS